jgi:beta-galactosidase
MQVSALPHTDEQMFPVEYKIDMPESTATVFCLSTKTLGVGSNSCGPRPVDKYLIWTDDTQFSYTLQLDREI